MIERFRTDEGTLERYHDIHLAPDRTKVLSDLEEAALRRLGKAHFDDLDQPGRIDYLLFQNHLRYEIKELEHASEKRDETSGLMPFAEPIVRLEEARRHMEPMDAAESAATLADLHKSISALQNDLEHQLKEKAPMPGPVVANRAARLVDELRRTLEQWHEFYAGYDPGFSWWAEVPYQKAEKALKDYAKFLREKLAGYVEGEDAPVIGDPIGREALLDALQNEMIAYTPEELIEIGQRELAWTENELRKASREMGCGDDWKKALDRVKDDHVRPGEQPALIRDLAREAIHFVEERDLVTVPPLCRDTWRMEMMSPERQKVNPYFTGGEVISVSFPTDSMTYGDKQMSMRGNNIHFCRATVLHEVIPGHHLQLYQAARYRTYRRMFRTPFLVEGWALYWEMRFWDLGFPRSPEDRIGMLFWRAHRCARIIFSLSFHLEKMTAPEAIDFLVEHVGHERRNATAEVRRSVAGDYGPLYQAAYMLGGLQLRALHHELVDSGKMTEWAFHDAVLHENAIPIAMIRASLTNQPLTPDFVSDWKFYEEVPASADSAHE